MRTPANPTPYTCWEELRPHANELLRLSDEAPLSEQGRAGLATIIAVHFFGAAIARQREALGEGNRPIGAIARELLELIVADLEQGDKPRLVATSPASDTSAIEGLVS